jgi:hypothetical protein
VSTLQPAESPVDEAHAACVDPSDGELSVRRSAIGVSASRAAGVRVVDPENVIF